MIALMFLATSVLGLVVSNSGYLISSVRNLEKEISDHDMITRINVI